MRVLTWNTWWKFFEWEPRQPLLDATVARVEPDVVLLQETWPQQAQRLAARCGLTVAGYAGSPLTTAYTPETADTPFGNAILAPAGWASEPVELVLPPSDGRAVRTALACPIAHDGVETLVVVTHLASAAADGQARQRQMKAIVSWVDEVTPDGRILLGGDLNQTPYSDEHRSSLAPNWLDLWADARPDDHGSTMVADNPNVNPTEWMSIRNGPEGPTDGVRFDYLLGRRCGRRVDVGLRATSIEVAGAAIDDWPSDHLGVLATIVPTD